MGNASPSFYPLILKTAVFGRQLPSEGNWNYRGALNVFFFFVITYLYPSWNKTAEKGCEYGV